MKFLVKYIMDVDDRELVELVNDYLYESEERYKSIDEIPTEEIFDALYTSDYINDDINYDLDLERLKITILEDGDKNKVV